MKFSKWLNEGTKVVLSKEGKSTMASAKKFASQLKKEFGGNPKVSVDFIDSGLNADDMGYTGGPDDYDHYVTIDMDSSNITDDDDDSKLKKFEIYTTVGGYEDGNGWGVEYKSNRIDDFAEDIYDVKDIKRLLNNKEFSVGK